MNGCVGGPNSKEVDQPLTTLKGSWIANSKFFRAAMDFKLQSALPARVCAASRPPENEFAVANLLRSEFVYHKRLMMDRYRFKDAK